MEHERQFRICTAAIGCVALLLSLAWLIWQCVSIASITQHQG